MLEAEGDLAGRVVRELESAVGLPVTDDNDLDRVPVSGADMVFTQAWSEAVTGTGALKSLAEALRPGDKGTGLWHSGRAVIWSYGKVSGEVREKLLALLARLNQWDELEAVRDTRSEFGEAARSAAEQAEIIVHGGFLQGTCDACKRFRL
jgi:hypothetical protein